jgi:hypothetical protein
MHLIVYLYYALWIMHNVFCMHSAKYKHDISYNAEYNETVSCQALLKHFKLVETHSRPTDIFNRIVKPWFDPGKLTEHGFNETLNYFTGTQFNKSVLGWAGQWSQEKGNLLLLGC